MTRKVPPVATLVVAAAVIAMVALGFWQLRRLAWKEGLLARYAQAQAMSAEVPWPRTPAEVERLAFRASGFDCRQVLSIDARAGQNAAGASGWLHTARCRIAGGGEATAAIGWSKDPSSPAWSGGEVRGTVSPGGTLYLRQPVAGLQAVRQPDPADLPNNHFAYAVQWFLFAATALVIYALALRRRWRPSPERGGGSPKS